MTAGRSFAAFFLSFPGSNLGMSVVQALPRHSPGYYVKQSPPSIPLWSGGSDFPPRPTGRAREGGTKAPEWTFPGGSLGTKPESFPIPDPFPM